MKKFFYLLLLLPFSMLMSCDDDKDFSPVDMTLTLDGVTYYNNSFYTISGDDVTIENLSAKALGDKNTEIANVTFYFDGIPLIGEPGNPFRGTFSTENIPAGNYTINVAGNLLQVDSSIKIFSVNYPLTIVASEDELPAGAPEIGSYSQTVTITKDKWSNNYNHRGWIGI